MKINEIEGILINWRHPFLIAEAGVNHEGSLDTALEMVGAAADAGADMIKFQAYKAESIASKESPAYWDRTQESSSSQYELFKKYDVFSFEDYLKIANHCKQKDILFSATPFDKNFVESLEPLMPVIKVASADITNFPLLKLIAKKNKPILLSVGASYLSEVEEAVRLLQNNGAEKIALLHCILQYPTDFQNANLLNIKYLQSVFSDLTIGWSDHIKAEFECLGLLTAWQMGAVILEKHFTLNKALPGNDHYHAMDPDDIRNFRERQQYIVRLMGQSNKSVFPCEEVPRKFARRSLVAANNISPGTIITEDMLTAKRPGTGISPIHQQILIGKKARVQINADDVLQWEMFF